MQTSAIFRRTGFLLTIAFLGLAAHAQSQQPPPVEFPEKEIASHRIGALHYIHTENVPRNHPAITLQVIITPFGNVESAQAINGPPQFYSAAEAVEMERQFKPFEKEGAPVRASIKDDVSIFPLERWAENKIPFPDVKDWNTLRITFKRKGCQFDDKECLSHAVEVRGDGSVTFTGGSYSLISGVHHGTISRNAIVSLVNEFRRAGYFSLKDFYNGQMTDASTTVTSIEFDGYKKQVVDYLGLLAGMPEAVHSVESAINDAAGTGKWLKETDETWPALLAEKWDFKARTGENRALFANVASWGSSELIENFLAAGAPALEMTDDGKSAIVSAASRGDAVLTARMIAGHDHLSASLLFHALRAAAASGNLATVDLLLQRGTGVNVNPDEGDDGGTVLMAAARSGKLDVIQEILKYHPEIGKKDFAGRTALQSYVAEGKKSADTEQIIQELVAAGADVNTRDNQGESLLFHACFNTKTVKPLANAGADLNAKNNNGFTAIMMCTSLDFIKVMIDAGADLSVQNKHGQTAAQWFRSTGLKEQAEILEAAMKAKVQQ